MSSSRSAAALVLAILATLAQAQERFPGIGRAATPKEVAAWDIDVRPDFKGLPPGRGTVAQGQTLWEAQCAGCHGVFGESNEVFSPIIGGTTKKDIETGRVANLRDPNYPQRTTMMKASQLSTLWDYIRRAMPWTAPKTLSPDEVYAVTAYMLHLADVLPADGALSHTNMAAVQARLPNRNGKTLAHAKWPGPEFGAQRRPDVQGSACMTNCPTEGPQTGPPSPPKGIGSPGKAGSTREPTIASFIPDHARNAHGNLAAQQREVGPQRGVVTEIKPAAASPQALAAAAATPVRDLLQKNVCLACHQIDTKSVGPSFKDVAAKHGSRPDAGAYLFERIRQGGVGTWGTIPMPPQSIDEADARAITAWLVAGAKP